ncbi:MAG: hypothetical protein MUE81_19710 [Thermoflexibacter sp.]|jgi:hypothetical protein|nr:hypothetical protein [Thermoflexibacter sp.]
MYNIVSFVCVDESDKDAQVYYPYIKYTDPKFRRALYWQLGFLCMVTSVRSNPDKKHLLYTNDQLDIFVDGVDLRKRLADLGVEIIHLPFSRFNPGQYAKWYKNAMYKLDVLAALKDLPNPSIYIDSDCLWVRPNAVFDKLMLESPFVLAMDTYHRNHDPDKKAPHTSMRDMGELFRQVTPEYPTEFPIWYGGELMGGSQEFFQILYKGMEYIFDKLMNLAKEGKYYKIKNGMSMLDSDELITTYIFNDSALRNRILDVADTYARRMHTLPHYNDTNKADLKTVTVWHLTQEKKYGLLLLFKESLDPKSDFWQLPVHSFARYLGEYVGVPQRKRFSSFKQQVEFLLASIFRHIKPPAFLFKIYHAFKYGGKNKAILKAPE